MAIVWVLGLLAVGVWTLAAMRRTSAEGPAGVHWGARGAVLVLLTGTALGYDLFHISAGPVTVTADRLMWGVLIGGTILCWLGGRGWRRLDALDAVLLAWLALLTASTFSHDWSFRDNLPLSRLLFFNLLPLGLYFAARGGGVRAADIQWAATLLAVFGLYVAVTGIAEWRQWYWAVWPRYIASPQFEEFFGRARGPLLNPVANGLLLVTGMLASWSLWHRWGRGGKYLIVLCAPIFLLAIYATLTRSCWLGAIGAVAIGLWLPASRPLRGALLCSAAVALVVGGALFGPQLNAFQRDQFVSAEDMAESIALRPMLATVAWRMLRDRPLWGHGFGQYTQAKRPYHSSPDDTMPVQRVLPYMQHNVFLAYLTETGIVGCSLLVVMLSLLVLYGWRLWGNGRLPWPTRYFGIIQLGVVGYFVINGMFHDVSIINGICAWMLVIAGLSASQLDSAAQGEPLEVAEG